MTLNMLDDLKKRLDSAEIRAPFQHPQPADTDFLPILASDFHAGVDIETEHPEEWQLLATNDAYCVQFCELVRALQEANTLTIGKEPTWARDISLLNQLPPISKLEIQKLDQWQVTWHETAGRVAHITKSAKTNQAGTRRRTAQRNTSVKHFDQTVSVPTGTLHITLLTESKLGSRTLEPSLMIGFDPLQEDIYPCLDVSLEWGDYAETLQAKPGLLRLPSAELAQIKDHPLDLQIKTTAC